MDGKRGESDCAHMEPKQRLILYSTQGLSAGECQKLFSSPIPLPLSSDSNFLSVQTFFLPPPFATASSNLFFAKTGGAEKWRGTEQTDFFSMEGGGQKRGKIRG